MTPDLVELGQQSVAAFALADYDAVFSIYALDAVWVAEALGVRLEGVTAVRGFLEDFRTAEEPPSHQSSTSPGTTSFSDAVGASETEVRCVVLGRREVGEGWVSGAAEDVRFVTRDLEVALTADG